MRKDGNDGLQDVRIRREIEAFSFANILISTLSPLLPQAHGWNVTDIPKSIAFTGRHVGDTVETKMLALPNHVHRIVDIMEQLMPHWECHRRVGNWGADRYP